MGLTEQGRVEVRTRVLVVEDEPAVAAILSGMFAEFGHQVIGVAAEADTAIAMAIAERPELILMDVQLRGRTDGIEAALRIRTIADVPIVFVTAGLDDDAFERMRRVEPYGLVLKPFDPRELEAAAMLALCKHRAFAALEERVRERTAALVRSEARSRQLSTLADLGLLSLRERDIQTIEREVAARVADTLGVELAGVVTLDPAGVIEPGGLHAYVLASETPVLVSDLASETRFRPAAELLARGVVSGVYASIRAPDGAALGILGASASARRSFADHDLAFVQAAACLVATAIDRLASEEARHAAQRRIDEFASEVSRIGAALRARDEFVAVVAHELRTPMAAIRFDVEALADAASAEPSRLGKRLARVERAFDRLCATVDAVLDLSKLTTGRITLHPEEVVLARLIADVVERLGRDAERAGCTLAIAVDEDIRGQWDRVRLEQIVTNLLSNALRFSPGSNVDIRADVEGARAELRVSDHGPGVPDADAERIFGRYERGRARADGGGLGVGLYVSRELAVAHGGSLDVEPAPEGGARFVLRLPLAG